MKRAAAQPCRVRDLRALRLLLNEDSEPTVEFADSFDFSLFHYIPAEGALEFIEQYLKHSTLHFRSATWKALTEDQLVACFRILSSPNFTIEDLRIGSSDLSQYFDVHPQNRSVTKLNLESLDLDGNALAKFMSNSNVTSLRLFGVNLTNDMGFLEGMPNYISLQTLDILHFDFSPMPIHNFINLAPKLAEFTGSFNSVDALSYVLKTNSTLRTMRVHSNRLKNVPLNLNPLSFNSTLQNLTLLSNDVDTFGANFHNSSLKQLTCCTTSKCVHELLNSPNIISCLCIQLTDFDGPYMSDFVKHISTLQSLRISFYSGLNAKSYPQFFLSLLENTSITEFSLCSTNMFIDLESSKIINHILKQKKIGLTKLDLSGTILSTDSLITLFDGLPGNSTLKSLSLRVGNPVPKITSPEKFIRKSTHFDDFCLTGEVMANRQWLIALFDAALDSPSSVTIPSHGFGLFNSLFDNLNENHKGKITFYKLY